MHPVRHLKMGDLNQLTIKKHNYIRELGFNLVVMKECQYEDFKKENSADFAEFSKQYEFVPRLEVRNALMGGRTNCLRLYYEADDSHVINYADVTSLYPFVKRQC